MRREKRGEMFCHSDRADSRTASAVRNTKRLMKIEMAGIDSEFAGATDANQGVEVGSIHIDLASRLVDFFADIPDGSFVDAMGRGISNHGGGDSRSVFLEFRIQVAEIDVPL
jgi:hypothetical protein